MTQIVGIVCKDAIVIASESQFTMGQNWKQFENNKIDSFIFKDRNHGIVAFVGSVKPALRVIEILKQISKERIIDNERVGVEIAREAIIQSGLGERIVTAPYRSSCRRRSASVHGFYDPCGVRFCKSHQAGVPILLPPRRFWNWPSGTWQRTTTSKTFRICGKSFRQSGKSESRTKRKRKCDGLEQDESNLPCRICTCRHPASGF
ncbi:MAG: hypothetical protein WBN75_06695 [Verrucomicrobiia bacterium]